MNRHMEQLEEQNKALLKALEAPHTFNANPSIQLTESESVQVLTQINTAQAATIAELVDALKQMLYIYDRETEPGTVGEMVCDVAREALAKAGAK